MSPADLTPEQRAAIAVRLGARLTVGDEVKGDTAGLGGYRCDTCKDKDKVARGCRLDGRTLVARTPIKIAHHVPSRPEDRVLFCPASVPGISIDQEEIAFFLGMRDYHGGLGTYYKAAVADLPEALVTRYERACRAEENFTAEVRAKAAAQAQRSLEG